MTDAEYEAQKARVLALVDKWVKAIGLGWWHIDFTWHRDARQSKKEWKRGWAARFDVSADWRYLRAYVNAYLPVIEPLAEDELEQSLVHELCHILVNEMADKADDEARAHEERVVTTLAKALIWARLAGEGNLGTTPECGLPHLGDGVVITEAD